MKNALLSLSLCAVLGCVAIIQARNNEVESLGHNFHAGARSCVKKDESSIENDLTKLMENVENTITFEQWLASVHYKSNGENAIDVAFSQRCKPCDKQGNGLQIFKAMAEHAIKKNKGGMIIGDGRQDDQLSREFDEIIQKMLKK